MKRFLALMLTLVLLLTVAAPAMAAGGEDAVCPDAISCNGNHVLFPKSDTTTYETSSVGHTLVITRTIACRYCTYTESYVTRGNTEAHIPELNYATCDGTTQTWYYGCEICSYHISTTSGHACPGGSHSGTCLWLPV